MLVPENSYCSFKKTPSPRGRGNERGSSEDARCALESGLWSPGGCALSCLAWRILVSRITLRKSFAAFTTFWNTFSRTTLPVMCSRVWSLDTTFTPKSEGHSANNHIRSYVCFPKSLGSDSHGCIAPVLGASRDLLNRY